MRCQGRSSSINEDCRVVAYASDGLATSSMAWASIKLEDGGAGGAESPERAEGVGSTPHGGWQLRRRCGQNDGVTEA